MTLSRRDFLTALGAGAVIGARPTIARVSLAGAPRSPADTSQVADQVARYFSNASSAWRVGAAYLDATPGERDAAALRAFVPPRGADPDDWWSNTTAAELTLHVRRRVRADFRSGDVVVLAGWVLARTEARLAALYVVTHPGS